MAFQSIRRHLLLNATIAAWNVLTGRPRIIPRSSASGGGGGTAGASVAANITAPPQERRVAEFRFVGGNVLDPRAIVDAMNDAYDQGYQIRGVIG